MAESDSDSSVRIMLRFYRYVGPYWKVVGVVFLAALLYSLFNLNAVALVKPAVESVQGPPGRAADDAGRVFQRAWLNLPAAERARIGQALPPDERRALEAVQQGPSTPEGQVRDPIERLKRRLVNWLEQQPLVQDLRAWFYPAGGSLQRIATVMLLVVGPMLLFTGFVYQYAHGYVVWNIMADLRMDLFRRLSSLSLEYFSHQRTGELVSRLTNDLNATQTALKVVLGKIFLQPIMFVVFLTTAVLVSWQLTLVVLLTFPVMALIMARYGYRIRRHSKKTLERLADVTDSITQVLSGIRVVKSFNMEEAENEEFRQRNDAQRRRAVRLVRNRAFADMLPDVFMIVSVAIVTFVAHYLVADGDLTLPSLMLCLLALGFAATPVRRIAKSYNDLQQSIAGVRRMFEILDTQPNIQDRPDAVTISGVEQGVSFEDVWFAYNDVPVLKGIDLDVPCGKVYAVVGETGAGKSTMLDLIPRFYDVTSGAVRIDGIDVRQIKRESLMQQIAIVGQHPFLFNRPLAENIRYGKPDATDEEVVLAAQAANIHEFIQSLPHGYQTLAGETGGRLSGGQRQCITIARAILKNAPILILDEATSSLDAESEMLVQRALQKLMRGRTTFVIAHRLSTVRHADRIIVLRDGQIVEQGNHEELLKLDGEYSRLYELQFIEGQR